MAKRGRVVNVNTVYDDLTNINRKLVSKYKLSKIFTSAVLEKGKQKVEVKGELKGKSNGQTIS